MKAIIFDLDDTLLWDSKSVDEAIEKTANKGAELTGLDARFIIEAILEEAPKVYATFETYPFTLKIGMNPFEGLWGDFNDSTLPEFKLMEQLMPTYRNRAWTQALASLGINDEKTGSELGNHYYTVRRQLHYLYPETLDVLNELQGQYRLALLTNGSPQLQNLKLAGVPELIPYFEHIVISGEFGVGKPDVSIFNHMLQLMDLNAQDVLMVGDKLTTDIKGSTLAKIKNIWISHGKKNETNIIKPTYEVDSLQEILQVIESIS